MPAEQPTAAPAHLQCCLTLLQMPACLAKQDGETKSQEFTQSTMGIIWKLVPASGNGISFQFPDITWLYSSVYRKMHVKFFSFGTL